MGDEWRFAARNKPKGGVEGEKEKSGAEGAEEIKTYKGKYNNRGRKAEEKEI